MQSKGVAVFWDYESCDVSSSANGYDIARSIRSVALTFGFIRQIKVYVNLNEPRFASFKLPEIRSDLQISGISIVDCPMNNNHDNAIERMILVEMFAYAIDNPEPSLSTIILISGDRNFAYAMSTLRMRGYRIVLISPTTVHASLKAQASECLDWYLDVLYAHHRASQDDVLVGQVPENFTFIRPSFTASSPDNVDVSTTAVSPGAFSSALPRVATHSVDQLSTSKSLSSEQKNQLLHGRNSPQLAEITLAPVTLDRSRSTSSALSSDPPKAQSREAASTPSTQAASRTASSPTSVVTRSAAPTFPVIYRPLVECLQFSHSKGVLQPLRSHIAAQLIKKHVDVYKSANVQKFSQYASQAEAAGIVDLGGKDGGAWIRLRPELHSVTLSN